MIPFQINIAFNLDDENGAYTFRMPTAPAYLKKHYQQKCLWNLTRLVLPSASTLADDNMILVRINVPSSQTFITGSAGAYASFSSESQARVQFFTCPLDNDERVEWFNKVDEIESAQLGGNAWGNDLEVSVYQVSNVGAMTLIDGTSEVIHLQLECVAYDDQYDYERFK